MEWSRRERGEGRGVMMRRKKAQPSFGARNRNGRSEEERVKLRDE